MGAPEAYQLIQVVFCNLLYALGLCDKLFRRRYHRLRLSDRGTYLIYLHLELISFASQYPLLFVQLYFAANKIVSNSD